MSERELFVVCNNCGNEVSPYVTECPYCGTRLRKRAPDLKKQRKQEEKEAKKAEKQRERLRRQYEGGGSYEEPGSWLAPAGGRPYATIALIFASVVVSLIARVDKELALDLIYLGNFGDEPWRLLTAPFVQVGFGLGFVCLTAIGIFGAGLEKRYGPFAVVVTWIVCGACGVMAEELIANLPVSNGAIGVAVGMFSAWTMVVVLREDLRDFDAIGLCAVAAVLLAMPLATDEASVWTLFGGVIGGLLCGAVLTRFRARAAY